ncbi:MAG: hypothetical protein ACKVT1_13545 [Dehalococcoidia bacterium]
MTAQVWLFGMDARRDVLFVVDITLPRTSLSTFDLKSIRSVSRRTTTDAPETETDIRAILTMDHQDGGRSGFFLDLHTTDADYSRLGRDVLERTVVVYDPRGGNLLVEVLDADL